MVNKHSPVYTQQNSSGKAILMSAHKHMMLLILLYCMFMLTQERVCMAYVGD